MGKYMRRTKVGDGEVAVMEVQQSSIGVRTRAKTLALQRHEHIDSSSYLQLRSRKLEKPISSIKSKELVNESPNSKFHGGMIISHSRFGDDEEVEVSDFEARNVRETTPCSPIRNLNPLRTPGSTTRRTILNSTSRRIQNPVNRNIPTTIEMDDFFSCAERLQLNLFTEKYNFDPVNECPLPGRYEWVKVEQCCNGL